MSCSAHDVRVVACELFFLPVHTRVPLKFGHETLTSVICARVKITIEGSDGRRANGSGETPLSVQWVWPSTLAYQARLDALKDLCVRLTGVWAACKVVGHPIEIGSDFKGPFDLFVSDGQKPKKEDRIKAKEREIKELEKLLEQRKKELEELQKK